MHGERDIGKGKSFSADGLPDGRGKVEGSEGRTECVNCENRLAFGSEKDRELVDRRLTFHTEHSLQLKSSHVSEGDTRGFG